MNAKKPIPPKLATWILLTFLRDDLSEEVLGDLNEKFEDAVTQRSPARAKLNYWYQVLHYMRPFAFRKSWSLHTTGIAMYKNYFITAYRNMIKDKSHSAINLAGLAIGMAVALMIGLWIIDEKLFDTTHVNHDRIGRVIQNVTNNGERQTWQNVPFPLADELRKNYGSDFRSVVLSSWPMPHVMMSGEKTITQGGIFAERDINDILSLTILSGSERTLSDPSSLWISESTAKALFGDADPLDKIVVIDKQTTAHVKVVYADIPFGSSFHDVKFIGAWEGVFNSTEWLRTATDLWRPNSVQVFVHLADHATFEAASARIKDAKLRRVTPELAKKKPELFIHAMNDWHLRAEFSNGVNTGGRMQYVWMFGITGSFVLLMACINFMNLTTARAEKRAKEIGVRKAIGSLRRQLVVQFYSESIFMALVSFALALLLVRLALPFFNGIAEKQMVLRWADPLFWLTGLGFCLVTGLIAGSYPALYLSAIQLGKTLKGSGHAGNSTSTLRKTLVVLQFTVSVVLIIGTSVVFQQIQHAKDRPVGYNGDGVVASYMMSEEVYKHFDAFTTALTETGAVISVAGAGSPPTSNYSSTSGIDWDGKDPDLSVDFPVVAVSANYGKTIGWELSQGRDFSRQFPSDSSAVILNEAAAHYMGYNSPVNSTVRWHGNSLTIIGVVKDMITNSPYDPVKPSIYFLSKDQNVVIMRIHPENNATEALSKIEGVFKTFNPTQPFNYAFVNQEFSKKFGNEERIAKLAGIFAGLAIFISALGIFGLASFIAAQRTKEIGVRKVLGASLFNLWKLLSSEFVLLVLVSCLVAVPIAYETLSSWLQRFNYHVTLSVWPFVNASLLTIVITLMTVSFQTLRAAGANPVKSLRTE